MPVLLRNLKLFSVSRNIWVISRPNCCSELWVFVPRNSVTLVDSPQPSVWISEKNAEMSWQLVREPFMSLWIRPNSSDQNFNSQSSKIILSNSFLVAATLQAKKNQWGRCDFNYDSLQFTIGYHSHNLSSVFSTFDYLLPAHNNMISFHTNSPKTCVQVKKTVSNNLIFGHVIVLMIGGDRTEIIFWNWPNCRRFQTADNETYEFLQNTRNTWNWSFKMPALTCCFMFFLKFHIKMKNLSKCIEMCEKSCLSSQKINN